MTGMTHGLAACDEGAARLMNQTRSVPLSSVIQPRKRLEVIPHRAPQAPRAALLPFILHPSSGFTQAHSP